MKILSTIVMLTVLGILMVACGGAKPEPVSYTIDLTEYAFTPNSLDLKVGQEVTLNLVNKGQLQHEVMFGRDVAMVNNRPAGYQVDMFATAGVEPKVTQSAEAATEEEETGFAVAVPPVGTATMTFPVTDKMVGDWEMGCFEQDGVHYDAGMKGPVSVKP